MVSQISKWFKRRFKELDLLEQYFPLLFTRWQAALWGGSVLAVAFGWRFITSDWPYPVKLTACIVALFFAGYYVWRADHVRLIPKLRIVGTRFQDTPVTLGGSVFDHRAFVQLIPECLTESPVYECVGYLQKIEKRVGQSHWEETAIDRNLILNWGDDKVELHPRSERPLNIFFIQRDTHQVIPNLKPDADIPWQKFDAALMNEPILRFHVQITCSDRINGNFVSIPSVKVCLEVRFAGPNRLRPQLELTQL